MCLCAAGLLSNSQRVNSKTNMASTSLKDHEAAMQVAIDLATQSPFCAVITNAISGKILAKGVNATPSNPILHGEIVCMNNYVSLMGNKNWSAIILYTTGEPCPMCMSALIWAGIGGVVFGSSINTIKKSGIAAFEYSAKDINEASSFSQTQLIGGVLETQCDALFLNRKKFNP